ncbi:MAG: radical SAM protein [Sphingomonas sp.]|uniref:radical SAM protein n=1 Tax=Sphingomonas sp. TaxID=28214 RepID=UPI003F7F44B8
MELHPLQLEALASNYLQLILLPTEQCNFRCTYCYETFEHRKMAPGVVSGVKALLDRRIADLDRLDIEWFGGEPLTAFEIVQDIAAHAQALVRDHGIQMRAGMTTNAYLLTPDVFATCVGLGILHYQISLDGIPATHNRTRRMASGAGTFDRIWANLLAARDSDLTFAIKLRLHFAEETIDDLVALGRLLRETFGDDPRFSYMYRPIAPYGGPGNATVKPIPWARRDEIEALLWERSGLPNDNVASGEHSLCYAGRANSLVVRSTGTLAKCTVAFSDEHNAIGRLLPDGGLQVDQEKFQRWLAPVMEENWRDAGCPLAFVARDAMLAGLPVEQFDPIRADEGSVHHGIPQTA